ncbi:MAG TPA: SAM-dependent chlorinase/fluorinase [Salinivirgaceae bacterium]|nr:SAM-dependent chlorinase/fluorinase [Salinivirgaceae bacterium]
MVPGAITLTTDWNWSSVFMGNIREYWLQNKIMYLLQELTHQIPPFNTVYAAYTVKASYNGFPQNSVHIIGVSPWIGSKNPRVLLVRYENHWFIGYECAPFYSIFDQPSIEIWELPFFNVAFPELELMIKPAIQLLSTGNPETVGKFITNPVLSSVLPEKADNLMYLSILYIDVYGNIVTNCTKQQFYEFVGDRKFEIMVGRPKYIIRKISDGYDRKPGDLFALFNAMDYLEIGIINYRLDISFGINPQTKINIKIV